MSNIMTITGGRDISTFITPEGEEKKVEALEMASSVNVVENEAQAALAALALKECADLSKLAEKSRVQIKELPLSLCKLIDKMHGDFVAQLENEIRRLKGLVGGYQMKIAEERRKAEQAAREEAARIEAERQKAIQDARKAQEALDSKARKEAIDREAQLRAEKQALTAAPLPVIQKQAGISSRPVKKFEVLDIEEVFKARPDFVVMSPNNAVIRDAISAGLKDCPGIRIWEEMQISTR